MDQKGEGHTETTFPDKMGGASFPSGDFAFFQPVQGHKFGVLFMTAVTFDFEEEFKVFGGGFESRDVL